jgi:hypothetical protein
MLWQAETHFRFDMIGGWVGRTVTQQECRWYWDYRALIGVRPPIGGATFRRFLLAHHVRAVIEGPGTQPLAARLVAAALPDVHPTQVADSTILVLPSHLPLQLPAGGPALQPAKPIPPTPTELPCTVPPYPAAE